MNSNRVLFLLLLTTATLFAQQQQVSKKADTPHVSRILFFMNPNGRPCQIQDQILKGLQEKKEVKFTIEYVRTTESADHEKFSRFGIRSLPQLIMVDKYDKIVHRFTPGIQDEVSLKKALLNK